MSKSITDFSALPTELRLQIWHFSCLIPRLIEVRTDDYPGNWNASFFPTRHGTKVRTIEWATKCPIPAALSVCHESREMALKVYTLRFEVLACGSYTIYINPLLDMIYMNFKWDPEFRDMLLSDMKAFDEEEIGIKNLALPLCNGLVGWSRLPLDSLDSLTLVIEDSFEPYWQDWDEDTALVAPTTEREVRRWEREGQGACVTFETAIQGREKRPVLNIAAIRRGDAARALSVEDRNFSALQGPRRPHINYDVVPAGVAVWDRYDM
ncbi:hypothetical protein N431DRAFT_435126 [Stipitochalara longipes BDJ]|nr:hypothetical protein N431DRAFT_435126 [Stipitochalara longipes BDJ]